MTKLTINGIEVQSESNWTILKAAEHAGLTIPTLCYHKDLSPTGACRMCLVNVKGAKGLTTACTTPVSEGMEVETENEVLASGPNLSPTARLGMVIVCSGPKIIGPIC